MSAIACPIRSVLATGVAIAASCAAAPVLADAPQAVTITTQVTFNPDAAGTFVATGPICSTGTFSLLSEVIATGPAAFNVNAVSQYVCDDNSGTFFIRVHPQAAPRSKGGFDLNGPWSIWGKGTGDYESLAGHGDFGVVFDPGSDPLTGQEIFVGFVTLKADLSR
jgi:hypothetical protein